MLLSRYTVSLVNISCLPSSTRFNALVSLGDDVSEVMPYLNAILPRANFAPSGPGLDFMRDGHIISLTPKEMRVTGVDDEAHARRVVSDLVALVNDTWEAREGIEPAREQRRPPTALEVLAMLPKTSCGECGCPTCLAFASAVAAQGRPIEECPYATTS